MGIHRLMNTVSDDLKAKLRISHAFASSRSGPHRSRDPDGSPERWAYDLIRTGTAHWLDGVDAPRWHQRSRVVVSQPTPGGIHDPGEHRRPRSRQVHLSAPWGRQRG